MHRSWLKSLLVSVGVLVGGVGGWHAQAEEPAVPSGWRVGPAAWSFNKFTLFDAIDKTAALGLRHLEAFEGQLLRPGSDLKVGADLPADAIAALREKLTTAKVALTSIYIHSLPGEEPLCRKAFDLCRALGLETIVSEPEPARLNLIERLCDEYGVNVAIHNHPKGSSRYWDPGEVLRVCEGRSPRLGACADIGHWQRCGIDPLEGVRRLGQRLLTIHVKDLNVLGPEGHDVPWGTGQGKIGSVLAEIHRQRLKPTLFTVEYEYKWEDNRAEIGECARFFHQTVAPFVAGLAPLSVGWASADITPPRPVALVGQLHKRISQGVRDPLTATALAFETKPAAGPPEQAILVTADLCFIQQAVLERLREMLKPRLPDFDVQKLVVGATHTHTGPGFSDDTFGDLYDVSRDEGVMKASEYADFFLDRAARLVVEAWQRRQPGGLSWGLAHATLGVNRRAVFADGKAAMYGDTSQATFQQVEGPQDTAVKLLFIWTPERQLSGVVVNVPCTSQEVEQLYEISADFWHDVRMELRRRHGPGLFVLPQCAPAGDQSPHPIYRKQAEQIMDLRRGLSRRKELARRIANAVDEALPVARGTVEDRLLLRHAVVALDLPEHEPSAKPFYLTDSPHPVEVHVLRLGEVALATSPFELFMDYATRIEARSPAPLTMQAQLTCACIGYLPTSRAVQGGGYSADKFIVGPVGGQLLVDETVKRINALFP